MVVRKWMLFSLPFIRISLLRWRKLASLGQKMIPLLNLTQMPITNYWTEAIAAHCSGNLCEILNRSDSSYVVRKSCYYRYCKPFQNSDFIAKLLQLELQVIGLDTCVTFWSSPITASFSHSAAGSFLRSAAWSFLCFGARTQALSA